MKKFDTVFRGYDKVQVQRCLDEIINNYSKIIEVLPPKWNAVTYTVID